MPTRKILLLLASAVLALPAYASPILTDSTSLAWLLLVVSLVVPVALTLVVSLLKRLVRPALPRRWPTTLLLTVLTWLSSLLLLFSVEHQGSQPSTNDWWSEVNIRIALALTTGVAMLHAFRPALPVADDTSA